MKTVYKVVRPHYLGKSPAYRSAWMLVSSGVGLTYEPNRVTKPVISGSYLFAFQTPFFARKWIKSLDLINETEIWEAYANEAFIPPFKKFESTSCGLGTIRAANFWQNPEQSRNSQYEVPKGSLLCSSIELIKKIS